MHEPQMDLGAPTQKWNKLKSITSTYFVIRSSGDGRARAWGKEC